MKFTNRTVAVLTLDTSESERIVWDDDIPGLGLRMRAGGSRNWVFQYKIGAKHRRIRYAGRPASAATATGLMSKHLAQLKQLLDDALA